MKKLLALYLIFIMVVIGVGMIAFPFYAAFNRVPICYSVALIFIVPLYAFASFHLSKWLEDLD